MAGPSSQERLMAAKWTRDELEDHYFRCHDENIVLKKHGRKQEDRIKRISTKLLRLMSDRKKVESEKSGGSNVASRKRDIETEQIVEEQQDRIRELERQNKLLLEKLIVVRQQLDIQLKRPVPPGYRHVSSRVDTGLPRYPYKHANDTNNNPGRLPQPSSSTFTVDKNETPISNEIETIVAPLREQLDVYEQEVDDLREQLREKQSHHEGEIRTIKSQLSRDQRRTLRENVSIIRLQRELKQKSSELLASEARSLETEQNLRTSRKEYEQLIANADTLGHQLQEEQQKNTVLHAEVVSLTTSNMVVAECKEKISDLEKENSILRESNAKLIESALDYEKLNQKFAAETARRQLELRQRENAAIKSTVTNDASRDELLKEREFRERLGDELARQRASFRQLEEQHENLKKKISLIGENGGSNLGDAPHVVQPNTNELREHSHDDHLLHRSSVDENVDALKKALTEVQADHAETVSELERTRNMLIVQHRINKDSREQVEALTRRLVKIQQDCEERLAEQGRLLELRAIRIQRLEHQLSELSRREPLGAKHENDSSNGSVKEEIADEQNNRLATSRNEQSKIPKPIASVTNAAPKQETSSQTRVATIENGRAKLPMKNVVGNEVDDSQSTVPTPKPRSHTLNRTSTSNDSADVSLAIPRRPSIVPRDSLKTIADDKQSEPRPVPITPIIEIANQPSYSDSSSEDNDDEDDDDDDDDIVLSGPNKLNKHGKSNADDEDDDDVDYDSESDSDEIVVSRDKLIAPKSKASGPPNGSVTIVVSHLSFTSTAILNDDSVRTLFVEYRFLNYAAEELETPFALPKPTASEQKIVYNFRKSFRLDTSENAQACRLFVDKVRSSSNEAKRITFTVVNEPPEDDVEADCEDIGFAYVDLGKIAASKKDIVDEEIEIFDADNPHAVIGHLGVTVNALDAMNSLVFPGKSK